MDVPDWVDYLYRILAVCLGMLGMHCAYQGWFAAAGVLVGLVTLQAVFSIYLRVKE